MTSRILSGTFSKITIFWRNTVHSGARPFWSSSSHEKYALTEPQQFLPDVRGLDVATANWKALEKLDLAIWDLARWNGDVCGTAKSALEHDPTCVLAHSVNALHLLSQRGAAASHPEVIGAMKASRQLLASEYGGERETVHAAAVEAWAAGHPRRAAAIYEAWLLKQPQDLLALRGAHDAHLACGDGQAALDSICRVKPQWDNTVFGYAQLQSMHSFALTEVNMGNFPEAAEEMANIARTMDKKDNWALHALVHVLEHGGRASEGASLLKNCRDDWEVVPEKSTAIHFATHLARFYLERGNYKAALRVLDTGVMEVLEGIGARDYLGVEDAEDMVQNLLLAANPAALLDATSLLWRLELSGISGGFRWCKLADYWDRISPGVLAEGDRALDDDAEDEGGLVLVAHRLTPLQAVHRSMAAVAVAEITRGLHKRQHDNSPLTIDDTGVGISFGEAPDLALAWQRKLDQSMAKAAAETAMRLKQGIKPFQLEARCMPASVLVIAEKDEDDNQEPLLLLETGQSGAKTTHQTDQTEEEEYTSKPLTGIEHLFDDMDGPRPLAPRAPFVRDPLGTSHGLPEQLAQAVAVGAVGFWQRDLEKCIEFLLPYKSHFHRLGGSVLEQETLLLTLLEATVRSSAPTNAPAEYHFSVSDDDELNDFDDSIEFSGVSGLMLARALLAERTAAKTGSAQAWIRYAVVLQRLGDGRSAEMAMRNAYALGIGQGGKGAN